MNNKSFKSKNGREYVLTLTNEFDICIIMELLDAECEEDVVPYKLVDYVFGDLDISKADDLKTVMYYVDLYESKDSNTVK